MGRVEDDTTPWRFFVFSLSIGCVWNFGTFSLWLWSLSLSQSLFGLFSLLGEALNSLLALILSLKTFLFSL